MSFGIKEKIEDLLGSMGLSYSAEVIYIFLLIVYISIVSIYTPRAFLEFVNKGFIKMLILIYIFYVVCIDTDIILGMFLLVAFVVTISLDNSIQATKILQPTEGFNGKNEEDSEDDDEDNEIIKVKVGQEPAKKPVKRDNSPKHEDFVNDEEDEEQFEDIMQNKALKDVFQNLHETIHELQTMVKK
jgi:hypothetical protein